MKARPAQRCAAIAASKTPVARREPERKLSLLRTICISAVERNDRIQASSSRASSGLCDRYPREVNGTLFDEADASAVTALW
jgi:hypothetical protein